MNPTQFKAEGVEVRLRPYPGGAVLEVWWFDDITLAWLYRDVLVLPEQLRGLGLAVEGICESAEGGGG